MPLEGQPAKGIVHVPSKYSVPETLQRLESVVTSHGLTVFARIDFGGDAAKVGLQMRPTQLLIFFGPPPSSDRAAAVTALVLYAIFAWIAFWLERKSMPLEMKIGADPLTR